MWYRAGACDRPSALSTTETSAHLVLFVHLADADHTPTNIEGPWGGILRSRAWGACIPGQTVDVRMHPWSDRRCAHVSQPFFKGVSAGLVPPLLETSLEGVSGRVQPLLGDYQIDQIYDLLRTGREG